MPRRALLAGLAAVPVAVLAACSKDKPKPAATSTSSSSTTTTAPPRPQASGKGLPADLLAVMTAMYVGGKVPASGAVAAALAKRKPAGKSVTVAGSTGTWQKTPIAVVTQGKDVTLLVKGKAWSVVGGWWPSMGLAGATPGRTMRILAIGSDARPSQKVASTRADSLHIIGIDAKGVGGILGIPRDSWVSLSSGGVNKINASLAFGGPKGVVRTVEKATGVQIDGYVLTGFKGFRALVNAIGGIRYVAPSIFKGEHGILAKKGLNILKGEPALSFARERHTLRNGDFGRSVNQGNLILAGMGMARSGGPRALTKYLSAMSPHVATDLTPGEVLNLSAAAFQTNPNHVTNTVALGGIGTRGGGQSVVLLGSAARADFRDMKDGRLRA